MLVYAQLHLQPIAEKTTLNTNIKDITIISVPSIFIFVHGRIILSKKIRIIIWIQLHINPTEKAFLHFLSPCFEVTYPAKNGANVNIKKKPAIGIKTSKFNNAIVPKPKSIAFISLFTKYVSTSLILNVLKALL